MQMLLCPCCDSPYITQIRVKTFAPSSDGNQTAVTVSEYATGSTLTLTETDLLNDNPGVISEGLSVFFMCNECRCDKESPLRLDIYQANGRTAVSWAYHGEGVEVINDG